MTHDGVMKMLDGFTKEFVAKIRDEVEDQGTHFGIYRRALERGADRLDIYGDMIVNQEMPEREEEVREQLQMLYSGILQVAVAACAIMEGLPDLPISGMQMITSEERH